MVQELHARYNTRDVIYKDHAPQALEDSLEEDQELEDSLLTTATEPVPAPAPFAPVGFMSELLPPAYRHPGPGSAYDIALYPMPPESRRVKGALRIICDELAKHANHPEIAPLKGFIGLHDSYVKWMKDSGVAVWEEHYFEPTDERLDDQLQEALLNTLRDLREKVKTGKGNFFFFFLFKIPDEKSA